MKKLLLFPLLACLAGISLHAQQHTSLTCKVTMRNGSIINGTLSRGKSKITPQEFEIYDAGGSKVLLTPGNTAWIETADSVVYRSAAIKIYKNVIEGSALNEKPDELPEDGIYFIERLIKGSVLNLYILDDRAKTHYIIEDSVGRLQSLRYVKFVDYGFGTFILREISYYKDQLTVYTAENDEATLAKISASQYSTVSMINVISSINHSNQLSKRAGLAISKRRLFFPFIEAGAGLMNIEFNGSSERLNNIALQNRLIPKLNVGVEMHPGKNEKAFVDLYASLYPYSFSGTYSHKNSVNEPITDRYDIKAAPVAIGVMVNYVFFKIDKIKFAFGAGYSLVINNISKNSFTTNDKTVDGSIVKLEQVETAGTSGQYSFDADVLFNKKLSFRAQFSPKQDLLWHDVFALKSSIVSGGVKYRL